MASYKEIVTKAIVGKGKKFFKNNYSIEATGPTNVLGCWVINHKFKGYKSGDKVGVDGSFDVNIWYSYENDSKTAVINKNIKYNDLFNVKVREDAASSVDTEIIARTLKQPTCSGVNISNGVISFGIEKELGVEILDDVDEDALKEIDENVNPEYLEKTVK